MKETYEFLKECGMYFLATVDGDKPKVRPFGTILLYEDKLYIQTGKVKDVSKQIAANPNVELCAFKYGEWLRVSAKAIRDDRLEVKEAMLNEYPDLKDKYKADDDNTEVLYLKDVTGTVYSFTNEPKVYKF